MGEDLRSVTELDRLIHEPARLLIVTILSTVASADFLFLQRETGLTKGNLSAHLSKLEDAGYVRIEKKFKGKLPLTVCKLTAAGQKALAQYRQHLQDFMEKTREGNSI
ncbi:MAG TPA: transcriptional regulator [Anaerolineales bacterium]